MYSATSPLTRGGTTATRHLLRASSRANGQVLHRTIAHVSHGAAAAIAAMRLALRHKQDWEPLGTVQDAVTLPQGWAFGAVWTLSHVARRLGIAQALGTTRAGTLALGQVMARVIAPGSRLSAVRLAMAHAACDVLGVGPCEEEARYENLDGLAGAPAAIADRLFTQRTKTTPLSLFLYEVTRSALAGTQKALAALGDKRDGKTGKLQRVIGLRCDADGHPVSSAVFPGHPPRSAHRGGAGCQAQGTVWRPRDPLRWRPGPDQEPANPRPRPAGGPCHDGDDQTPDGKTVTHRNMSNGTF